MIVGAMLGVLAAWGLIATFELIRSRTDNADLEAKILTERERTVHWQNNTNELARALKVIAARSGEFPDGFVTEINMDDAVLLAEGALMKCGIKDFVMRESDCYQRHAALYGDKANA